MTNRLYVLTALLANVAGQLNTLEFNEAWKADADGSRPGLMADEELLTLPDGVVHSALDENERFMFIVIHNGTINIVQETGDRIEDGTLTQMSFDGSEAVAGVLETAADGGGVTLGNLAAFFVFFGPDAVARQLQDVVRQMFPEDAPAAEATSEAPVSDEAVMAEVRSLSPKSAHTLDRMQARSEGRPFSDVCPDPNRLAMMMREPRTIILDSGLKRIGAAGVIGLAAYGLFRLVRR